MIDISFIANMPNDNLTYEKKSNLKNKEDEEEDEKLLRKLFKDQICKEITLNQQLF